MYDFLDRKIADLDTGGRLLVWAMRNWVVAHCAERSPSEVIAPAFANRNLAAGTAHFDAMMEIIGRNSRETFGFGPPRCKHIREHEALFLSLIHGMHMSRIDNVRATLQLMVHDNAIAEVMPAIAALSEAMADAGLRPEKPASAARP